MGNSGNGIWNFDIGVMQMAKSLKLKLEARGNILQAMNSSTVARPLNEGSIIWIVVWAFNLWLDRIIKRAHPRMKNVDAFSASRTADAWDMAVKP
jgi:hypothetical protein